MSIIGAIAEFLGAAQPFARSRGSSGGGRPIPLQPRGSSGGGPIPLQPRGSGGGKGRDASTESALMAAKLGALIQKAVAAVQFHMAHSQIVQGAVEDTLAMLDQAMAHVEGAKVSFPLAASFLQKSATSVQFHLAQGQMEHGAAEDILSAIDQATAYAEKEAQKVASPAVRKMTRKGMQMARKIAIKGIVDAYGPNKAFEMLGEDIWDAFDSHY